MAKQLMAILAIAIVSCGVDKNGIDTANLDDRQSEVTTDPRPDEDPTMTDPGPQDQPCDPNPNPDPRPPENECEQRGALCLPLDPNGMYPACPDGLYELPLGCPFDEANQIASACCGFTEEPPTEPTEDPCSWSGGVCWQADEAGNVACPEGLEPRFDIPCFSEDRESFSVCCAFIDTPPPPPPDDCPDRNDPSVRYVGFTPDVCDAIEYLCSDPSAAFVSSCGCGCFERPENPPGPPPEEERCPDANDPDVIYVSEDLGVCAAISYTCPSNHVVFTSDCGCGCLGY